MLTVSLPTVTRSGMADSADNPNKNQPPHTIPVRGPEFQSTFLRAGDEVASTFKRWLDQKLKTPLQLVGYDKPFSGGGNYSGLSHAHMGQDVSIVYKLEGKEPRKLKLYGFFSHEDLGTGQPPKQKIQQKTGKRLKTQVFEKRKPLAE